MAASSMAPRSDHLTSTAAEPRAAGVFPCSIVQMVRADRAGNVRLLQLHLRNKSDEGRFRYEAGQWVDFFVPGVDTVGGYSFVTSQQASAAAEEVLPPILRPSAAGFTLAVKHSRHPPAAWVHDAAEVGAAVEVRVGGRFTLQRCGIERAGPAGAAHGLDPSVRHILMIAGGVGINPIFSMLLQLSHHFDRRPSDGGAGAGAADTGAAAAGGEQAQSPHLPTITLLYSGRSQRDVVFADELSRLATEGVFAAAPAPGVSGGPTPGPPPRSLLRLQLFATQQSGPAADEHERPDWALPQGSSSAEGAATPAGSGVAARPAAVDAGAVRWCWGRRMTAIDVAAAIHEARQLGAAVEREARRGARGGALSVEDAAAEFAGGACGAGASARRVASSDGSAGRADAEAHRRGIAVLVCGPPAMTDAAVRWCTDELGLAPTQVHHEKWW
jgi:NAD(P)H-flavin reductase